MKTLSRSSLDCVLCLALLLRSLIGFKSVRRHQTLRHQSALKSRADSGVSHRVRANHPQPHEDLTILLKMGQVSFAFIQVQCRCQSSWKRQSLLLDQPQRIRVLLTQELAVHSQSKSQQGSSIRRQQQYHDLTWFHSLSGARNRCLYLRMAHGHLFNKVEDSGSGVFYLYSVTLRHSLERSKLTSGRRAPINHLTLSSDEAHPEAEFSKFNMSEYFTDIMVFSARASLFEVSKSACEFTQHHVLYHESIALSP